MCLYNEETQKKEKERVATLFTSVQYIHYMLTSHINIYPASQLNIHVAMPPHHQELFIRLVRFPNVVVQKRIIPTMFSDCI